MSKIKDYSEISKLLEEAKVVMGHTKQNLNVSFAKSKINEAVKALEKKNGCIEAISLLTDSKVLMGHTRQNLNVSLAKSKIDQAIALIEA